MNYNNKKLNRLRDLITFLLFFLSYCVSFASLSGNYTINPSSAATASNYKSFGAAISDLTSSTRSDGGTPNGAGVTGAVVFSVSDGSYTEQLIINPITGTSTTNTVTFKSASNDSSKVTINFASGTANNFVVQFNGADYIIFSRIGFNRTGASTSARLLDYKSGANSNQILNCYLKGTKIYSSSTSQALIYSGTDLDTGNIFKNNLIRNGGYGFYWYGTNSSTLEAGTTIQNNIFDSTYYIGISSYYQDRLNISGNSFNNFSFSSAMGINLYYAGVGLKLLKNIVIMPYGGNYGINVNYCSGLSTRRALIANNMVSVAGTGTNFQSGIYHYYSSYTDLYYNSVLITNTNTNAFGVYSYSFNASQTNNIFNNCVLNTGGGQAMYIYYYDILGMNYNNWYTNSFLLGTWNGTPYANLTAWKGASSYDLNSISTDPYFYSFSNLHINHPALNGKATPLATVKEDIDGQTRNVSTPDIGADEFTPPLVDAGISALVNPNGGYCPGSQSVSVTMTNFGLNTLTSVAVQWSVNGALQTPYSWSGSVNTGNSATFNIGTFNFVSGNTYNIKTWTNNPNSTLDPNKNNDSTIALGMKQALGGTYTIGGTSPDYANFNAAINDLNANGVCAPVIFNVRDGSYNEQIVLVKIKGSSAVNTITFQSQNLDSSKVTLFFTASSANNYVASFNGATYIIFKKIGFQRTGSGSTSTGRLLEFKGGASNNTITNCQLLGLKPTNYFYNHELIYSGQDLDTNNTFNQNLLRNGTHGFYWFGVNTSNKEKSTKITNNIIDSTLGYGNYFYYQDGLTISGNTIINISTGTNSSTSYGLNLYYCDNTKRIYKNKINLLGAQNSSYGLYLNQCISLIASPNLVANNMISVAGAPSSGAYGVYSNSSPYYNFYFNTLHIPDAYSNSYAIYINANSGVTNFMNNIASNTGGGLAIYVSNSAYVFNVNFNNYFVTGAILGNWNGNAYANFTTWKIGTSKDVNSVNVNPFYNSKFDLHVSNSKLNSAAAFMFTIADDIDGQVRTNPTDIGADEFTPPSLDAGVISIDNPFGGFCTGSQSVKVSINNFGTSTITSVSVRWSVNGVNQTPILVSGSLTAGAGTQVTLGSFSFIAGNSYTIKAWTSTPNGSVDAKISNDSAFIYNLPQSMSGTYTIGGASPDYLTFSAAAADLNLRGICGAVVFNVRDGQYNEQFSLNSIVGASATNTITFQSQSLDSSKVRLYFASGGSSLTNYLVQLNGASHFIFRKISFARTGSSTYGVVFELKKGANGNKFLNNRLSGSKSSTTSTSNAIVYSNQDNDTGNAFINNYFVNGAYGLYWYGTSSVSMEKGTVIDGNTFDSTYYMALQLYYQDGVIIKKNTIKNILYTNNGYGIYLYYANNATRIQRNNITIDKGGYGIYGYYLLATASAPALVSNNFIIVNGGVSTNYCANLYYTHYLNFYSNSMLISNNLQPSTRVAYFYGYSSTYMYLNIVNNIFVNMAKGVIIEVPNGSHVNNANNNNYYNNKGAVFGYWNGTATTNLATWKTASTKDATSLEVNPYFASNTDLHISNVALNAKATPFASVTDDIDGEARTATPDIGADEFIPKTTDAGISSIDNPVGGYCIGTQTVIVSLVNFGLNTISSVSIHWQVNGVTQTPAVFNGSLLSGVSTTISIGTYSFISGTSYSIKSWTSSPNSTLDENHKNDTSSVSNLLEGLQGTYTIGGISPDFANFTLAANALNIRGVCGPVIFNVRDSSYNEQISLKTINGASSINTITFQSENLDSSKVTLYYASGGSSATNYVVQLDGTNYVRFNKIGFSRPGTNSYATIIELKNGAHNNRFYNNLFRGGTQQTTSNFNAIINFPSGDVDSSNWFINNLFRRGSYAIYNQAKSTLPYETGIVIENNIIDSAYYMGIYCVYIDRLTIKNNLITNLKYGNGTTNYGLYLQYCTNRLTVTKNKIFIPEEGYGMYIQYCASIVTNPANINNNFITVGGKINPSYGIYSYYNSYHNYFGNNILVSNLQTNSAALQQYGYSSPYTNNRFVGNCFSNIGGGYALNIQNSSGVTRMNYNNYYTTGQFIGSWNGTNRRTLANWKTGSLRDTNSHSVDPYYYGANDLHVWNPILNASSVSLPYLNDDIDNEVRNASTPDIGADEFTPKITDAGIVKLSNPDGNYCLGSTNVTATLVNFGTNNLTSATINWSLNGFLQTPYYWTGTLTPGSSAQVIIASYSFPAGNVYKVKVYTSNPNGTSDGDNFNDTTTINELYEGMKGTYTIGGTTPDYANFTAAVNDLNIRGLCDNVIFNVRNGGYLEQISINQYAKAHLYTVTFQGQNGDSSLVNLNFPSSSSGNLTNYTVQLNGADNVTFRKMTISRTGTSSYGRVVDIKFGAHKNRFQNLRIIGVKTSSTNPQELIYSGNDRDTNNIISNNVMRNGSYGIYIFSNSSGSSYERGNIITNNIMDSIYAFGIYSYYQDSLVINGNKISVFPYTSAYGIMVGNSQFGLQIRKNQIYLPKGGTGVYLQSCNNTSLRPGWLTNNMVSIGGTSGNAIGLYAYFGNYLNVYNNSFLITHTNVNSKVIYHYYNSNLNLVNNNLINFGDGLVLDVVGSLSYLTRSNNNNFYTTGTIFATCAGLPISSTLNAWKFNSKKDTNSITALPFYTSYSDLHANSVLIDGKGRPMSSIPDDFDGEARDATTPDIGADEFIPINHPDAAVINSVSPQNRGCASDSSQVGVVVLNNGTSSISNIPVTVIFSGGASGTLKDTLKKTLAPRQYDTLYFKGTYNASYGGIVSVKSYTDLSGDVYKANDTMYPLVKFVIRKPKTGPIALSTTRCGAGKLVMNAVTTMPGLKNYWYDSASGGTLLHIGDTFVTPIVTKTTNFYVASQGLSFDTIGTSFMGYLTTNGAMFDVTAINSLTIDSFDLNINGNTPDSVEVYYRVGTYLGYEFSPSSWIKLGTQYVVPNGAGQPTRIFVGHLPMAAGQTYGFYTRLKTTSNLRTSNGNLYTPGFDISINSGKGLFAYFNSVGTAYGWNGRVYYQSVGCPSARAKVTGTITHGVSGAQVLKGAKYDGVFNAGTATNPDIVCPGDTISYEMTPPTGYFNPTYFSKWKITAFKIATASGTVATDTATIIPSAFNNFKVTFRTKNIHADSLFLMRFTLTDSSLGCDTNFTRYIYVNPITKASFNNPGNCLGSSITFNNTSTAARFGTPRFSWDFGDGDTSNLKNPNHTYASTGSFDVKVRVYNPGGCSDSNLIKIVTFDPPKVKFGISATCLGDSVSFTDSTTIVGGLGNIAHRKWYFGDGDTSNKQHPKHLYGTTTNYTVSLVQVSNKGCKDSLAKIITIATKPKIGMTLTNSFCLGDTVKFNDTATNIIPTSSYNWSFGNGNTNTIKAPTQKYANIGSYKVKLIVANNSGCSNADSINITINPLPNKNAGLDKVLCLGSNTTIGNPSTAGNTYAWTSFPSGYTSNSANPIVSPTTTTTYYLTETKTSSGCSNKDTVVVTVNASPTANAGKDSAVCFGSSAQIGSASFVGHSYKWTSSPSGYTSTTSNPFVSPIVTTTYYLTDSLNATGCKNIDTVIVTVNPLPTKNAGADKNICLGSNTTIGNSATVGNTYSWTSNPIGFTSTSANPTVSPNTNTTYYLTETKTSTGCSNKDTAIVTINAAPTANAGIDKSICNGSSVSIGASAVTGHSYRWYSIPSGYASNLANPIVSPNITTSYVLVDSLNSTSCVALDTVVVTVNSAPIANAGKDSAICIGNSAQIGSSAQLGHSYKWTSSPSGYSSATANPFVSPTTTTIYYLTDSINATGCKSIDTVVITVNPLPTKNAGADKVICNGSYTNIGNSATVGNTYSWVSSPSGFTSTSANPLVSPSNTTTYYLTETKSATGCNSLDTVIVTVNASPIANAGVDKAICSGSSVSIGATAVAGHSYRWYSIPSGYSSNVANPTVLPTITTTYIVVDSLNSTSCTASDTVIITVNPKPSANAGKDSTICFGNSAQIGSSSQVGHSYKWSSSPSGYTSIIANPFVSPTITTTYYLTDSLTATGCKSIDTVIVTVNPLPSKNAGADKSICMGSSTIIGNSPIVGNTYSWASSPSGYTSTSANPSISPTTTTTYYLTETKIASGCSITDTVVITVNPLPIANAGKDSTICFGNSAQIGSSAQVGHSYKWTSNPSGYTSTTANPIVSPTITTIYYLTDSLNATGCKSIDTVMVTVNPLPTKNAGTNKSICNGSSTNIGNSSTAGNTYSWTSNPSGFTSTSANPLVSPSTTTTYYLIETKTASGCSILDSVKITVNPLPIAIAGKDSSICFGNLAQIGSNSQVGHSYKWSSNPSGYTSTTAKPIVSPTITTTYYLTDSLNATGCKNTDTVIVTVNPLPAKNAGVDKIICNGSSTTIGNTATIGNTYSWASSPSGYTSTSANPTVSPSVTTTYYLTETKTSTGCSTKDTVVVTINTKPIAKAGSDKVICNGNSVAIGSVSIAGHAYRWYSIPSGFTSSVSNPIVAPILNTTYIVIDSFTGSSCFSSDTMFVTVNPLPSASVGSAKAICKNQSTSIGNTAVSGSTYTWTSKPTGFTSTVANPTVSPTVTTKYFLTETITATGCKKTDSVEVTVNPLPIPIVGKDSAICIGAIANRGASPISGNTYAWSSNPIGYTSTNANISVSPTLTTKYYLTQTITATGCSAKDSVRITVNPLPSVNAGADFSICLNTGAKNLSGFSPANGVWRGTGITDSVNGTFNPNTAGLGYHKIIYYFKNSTTGCSNKDTLQVAVKAVPQVSFTADTLGCLLDSIAYNNSSTGDSISLWKFGSSATDTRKNTKHAFAVAGNYKTTLISTSAYGCKDSATANIRIIAKPKSIFTSMDSACKNANINFTNSSTGVINSYYWNFGNGDTSSSKNPSSLFKGGLGDTTYRVILVTNNYCGTDTANKTILIKQKPKADFTLSSFNSCSDLSPTFTNNSSGRIDKFKWDFGNTQTSSLKTPTSIQFNADSVDKIYRIKLSVENQCDTNSITKTVTIYANKIKAEMSPSTKIGYVPLSVKFSNKSKNTLQKTISFNYGDGNSGSDSNHTFTVAGTYLVKQIVSNGCVTDTDYAYIRVLPIPIPLFIVKKPICLGDSAYFTNQSTDTITSEWIFGDGTPNSNLEHPAHLYAKAGNYKVTLNITTKYGYKASYSDTVTIHALPDVTLPDTVNACYNQVFVFNKPEKSGENFTWDFGDLTTGSGSNPTHTYTSIGTYNYKLTATNAYGCFNTNNKYIIVRPVPTAGFNLSKSMACVLPITTQVADSSIGATKVQYHFGDGRTSLNPNPIIDYYKGGVYTIKQTVTNQYGCQDTTSKIFIGSQMPKPDFGADKLNVCENTPITFVNKTGIDSFAYLWSFGDSNTSTIKDTLIHTYQNAGVYSVTLTATNQYGCSTSVTKPNYIGVQGNPKAGFKWEVQYDPIYNGTVFFTPDSSAQAKGNIILWAFGDGTGSDKRFDIHKYEQYDNNTKYIVSQIVQSQFGCADTLFDTVSFEYHRRLFFPNAMRVSSNIKENTVFIPKGMGIANMDIEIFNRWGQVIWRGNKIEDGVPVEGWDGTFRGKNCPTGVYIWSVKGMFQDGTFFKERGTVTLFE